MSGAHLNPVVTLAGRVFGGVTTGQTVAYLPAQVAGGCGGAAAANLMFGLHPITVSTHHRSSGGLWLSEALATFGLVVLVFALVRAGRTTLAPFAVGRTSAPPTGGAARTSFANPAVTVGRTLSDTFAGIAPASAPMFVVMQAAGAAAAVAALYPSIAAVADDVVVPHEPSAAERAHATVVEEPP